MGGGSEQTALGRPGRWRAHDFSLRPQFRGDVVQQVDLATSVETIDAFLRPLRRGNIEVIALEAGSTSIYLARGLERLKYSIAVFETRQMATYLGMKQNKTDRNDARSIAEVARSGRELSPRCWSRPSNAKEFDPCWLPGSKCFG